MKIIAWHLNRFVLRFHPIGLLSALMIGSASLFHWLVLTPAILQLEHNQISLHGLQVQAAQFSPEFENKKNSLTQLSQIYELFPVNHSTTLSEDLEELYSIVQEHNLVIEKASYQLATDSENQLDRYNILLPVKGSYPQLRLFIAQLLSDMPHLVLETVSFSRTTKEDPVVEAQLQFTLYFRPK